MLRPWQKGVPRSAESMSVLLAIVKPCLEMVRAITQYLIMARGTEVSLGVDLLHDWVAWLGLNK